MGATARAEMPEPPPALPAATVAAGEYVHEEFEPVPPAKAAPPASPAVAAPPPLELDWSTDLVQVESDPRKMKAIEQNVPQASPAPRPKRERPLLPPLSEGPLVQIETQKPGETATPKPPGEPTATTLPTSPG
jgi:ribonuclease E